MSSPAQPLTNSLEGDWQVARVVMEAEGSANSIDLTDSSASCLPVDPTPSHIPFTCSLVLVNPLPELSLSDLFEATPVYIPKEGKLTHMAICMQSLGQLTMGHLHTCKHLNKRVVTKMIFHFIIITSLKMS